MDRPRGLSRVWTADQDRILVECMHRIDAAGHCWSKLVDMLPELMIEIRLSGFGFTQPQVERRIGELKWDYFQIRHMLRVNPLFHWDAVNHKIDEPSALDTWYMEHPVYASLRFKSFPLFEDLDDIFDEC
ncbi:amino acid permease 2-like protein [Corchorus olitorius]|uniref:Amino acid permease 2-like protein n=1 Tax=Corchorus olitorius TaxID=93759 RepID=A0A1R3ICU3_9ROSI|nr:amino acid permease 2-like protein [Corchorus olitorius]